MATTKCDIIRDVATANTCGMCGPSKTIPVGCGTNPPPRVACDVVGAANARMKLFASQYSPANLYASAMDKAIRTQEERIYEGIIQRNETNLAAAYPTAADVNISWPDFEMCLWNANGTPGETNNVYFSRADATQLGMSPAYPVGGTTLQATNPTSPVPLIVDYIMNPKLFTIIMLTLLVFVFAALIWSAWRSQQRQKKKNLDTTN